MFVAGWRHALRSEWPFIIINLLLYYAKLIIIRGNRATEGEVKVKHHDVS